MCVRRTLERERSRIIGNSVTRPRSFCVYCVTTAGTKKLARVLCCRYGDFKQDSLEGWRTVISHNISAKNTVSGWNWDGWWNMRVTSCRRLQREYCHVVSCSTWLKFSATKGIKIANPYRGKLILPTLPYFRTRISFARRKMLSSWRQEILEGLSQTNIRLSKMCTDRESNPGLPRGRREFYHWTIRAFVSCKM